MTRTTKIKRRRPKNTKTERTDQAPREQQSGTSLWRMSRYLLPKWFRVESAITWKNPCTSCFPSLFSEGWICPEPTELQGPTAKILHSRKQILDPDFHKSGSKHCFRHIAPNPLQHWGRRDWDGWWSHLVQAGVCLEAKVLPVPSLKPEALGWAGYAQLWLVLTPLTLLVWGAALPRSRKCFSCNPQSQAWPELIFNSIPGSFPWTSAFQHIWWDENKFHAMKAENWVRSGSIVRMWFS